MTKNYDYIYKCFRWLLNESAEFYTNKQLPMKLQPKWDKFYKCVSDAVDWYNLTFDDVTRLGFLNWDDDLTSVSDGIWFIPEWVLPALPDGLPVFDKNGEQFILNKENVCKDVMFGYLTFGIKIVG